MGMEEHHRVDQAQQHLDEMDSRLDQRVGLNAQEAAEMTDLYMRRVDELQERLAALGTGSEELDFTVMDQVADFLERVNAGNYGRLKEDFSTFLEEQVQLVEGMERVQAVPPEFDRLVSSLGYGHEVAADYYEVYQRTPESQRLSMDALDQKFTDLEEVLKRIKDVSGVSPLPQASGIMAEAFSLLINGDVIGFNERMDKLNMEEEFHLSQKAMAKNKILERELADLTARASRYDRAIEETRRDVADLQAHNSYWSGRDDERIAVQLKQFRDLEFKREFVGRTLEAKHQEAVENNAVIFGFQYRFGVTSGAPQNETDRLLLDMSKALGDQMPADLKDELAYAYERVIASGELSEFERAYYAGDASAVRLAVDEYTGTPEGERTKEQEQQVVRALETNPDLKKIREVSSVIYGKMGPVMDLLYVKGEGGALQHVTEEGAMTFEYVFELKRRVQSLSDVYNPGELRALLVNARSSLVPLKSIRGGKGASEFETLVAGVTGSLDQLETLLNEGQIETLEAMVLTDSFHKESLGEWLKRDGVVLAFAIVGGMVTFGLASGPIMAGLGLARGGYSALVVSSGLMAAGGVVGAEVGREVSDVVFDTGMESNLRRCFEGKMAVDDLLAGYGKEFVVGWASSMLFMVGGRIFLQSIARTAESSVAYASRGAQGLQDVARSVRDFAARVTPPVPGGPLAQTFLQFSSEMAEELAEDAAQNIHPALGVAVQFWNSLDGHNLEASTDASIGIAQVSQVVKGRDVQSKFEYAAGNEDALVDHLRKTHPDMTVTMDENGLISARISATFAGKANTHTMEFAPTNESVVMRQTLRRSVKPGEALSTSVLTQKYGVKLGRPPASYTYDSLAGGRMDRGLIPHLKADGYIIMSMKEDGSFVARKGEDTVAFKPKGELSARDRAAIASEQDDHHDHDHDHAHEHSDEELTQDEVVALRNRLLDTSTEEGKRIDELLKGQKVEIDGREIAVNKRILIPDTLIALHETGTLNLSSYDLYLHGHLAKQYFAYQAKNGSVPDGEFGGMLAKTEQGMEIFLKSHQEISTGGREMVRAFMNETVDNIMADFVANSRAEGREVDLEAVAILKQKILEAAIDQNIDNPPQYVSHGFDHSLRVMDHVKTVAKSDPAIIDNMADKWGISHAQAELFALLNGVCHDFGYPDVAEGLAKSQHAVTGSHRFIMEIGPYLARAAGLDLENPQHQDLLADFARCIQCHSADKHEHSWKGVDEQKHELILDTKITVTYRVDGVEFKEEILCNKDHVDRVKMHMKEYFKQRFDYELKDEDFSAPVHGDFTGRHFDIPGSNSSFRTPGGIEYRAAELVDPGSESYDPLLAMTRYADNLDMDPSRFSEFQRSPLFTSVYTRIGAERAIGDLTFSGYVAEMLAGESSLDEVEAVLHFDSKDAVIYEGEIYNLLNTIVLSKSPNYKKVGQLRELLNLLDRTTVKIGRYGKDSPNGPEINGSEIKETIKGNIDQFIDMINTGKIHMLEGQLKSMRGTIVTHIFKDETATEPVFTSEQEKARYEADKALVEKYLGTINEESFRHFGGCNPIETTTIQNGTVKIRMRKDIMMAYKNLVAKEKGPDGAEIVVPVSIYQVWRAVEAYQSLTINGRKAKFEITIGDKTFYFDPEFKPDGSRRDPAKASADFVVAFRNWQRGNL